MQMLSRYRGFTLMEMVITISLLAILFGVGAVVMNQGFTAYLHGQDLTEGTVQGRLALERMTRDLRDIHPSALGTLSANEISFTDRSGDVITYEQNSTLLYRQTNSALAQTMASGLDGGTGLVLTYWKQDGITVATTATDVYYINISLLIDYPSLVGSAYQIPIQTTIFLRNA